jgi:hypothetical protein
MKGGAVLFNSTVAPDIATAFVHWLNNLNGCRILTNTSAYGTLFELSSTSRALKSMSIHDGFQNVTTMILKVAYISDVRRTINAFGRPKQTVTLANFQREATIQNQVYLNSLNTFFDPICPAIINCDNYGPGAARPPHIQRICAYPEIRTLMDNNHVGLIFMEVGGVATNPVADVVGPWHAGDTKLTEPYANNQSDQSIAMVNYVYQLIRLQALGIQHGDSHLGNALVCRSTNPYYQNKKVLLLDFGLSRALTVAETNDINHRWYTTTAFWSYEAIQGMWNHLQAGTLRIKDFLGANKTVNIRQFIDEMNFHKRKSYVDFIYEISRNHLALQTMGRYITDNLARLPNLEDYGFLMNYRGVNDQRSKEWIFTQANILRRVMATDVSVMIMPVNNSSNCCHNTARNGYYNYLERGNSYNYQYAIDRHTATGRLIRICQNQQLLDEPNGYYLWVIGSAADNITNLFAIYVSNPGEIGTKHAHLMRYANIQNFYLAGELQKTDDTISLNLSSGTFMFNWITMLGAAPAQATLDTCGEIAAIFFRLTFSRSRPMTIRYIRTSISPAGTYLQPTFIIGTNQEMCNLARNSRDLTNTGTVGYPDQATCRARPMPAGLLVGGNGQLDDAKLGEKYDSFVFSTLLYDTCIEIPPDIIDFIKKDEFNLNLKNNLDMLEKLVYITKSDVYEMEENIKHNVPKEKEILQMPSMPTMPTSLPKSIKVAGKKSRKSRKRKK